MKTRMLRVPGWRRRRLPCMEASRCQQPCCAEPVARAIPVQPNAQPLPAACITMAFRLHLPALSRAQNTKGVWWHQPANSPALPPQWGSATANEYVRATTRPSLDKLQGRERELGPWQKQAVHGWYQVGGTQGGTGCVRRGEWRQTEGVGCRWGYCAEGGSGDFGGAAGILWQG